LRLGKATFELAKLLDEIDSKSDAVRLYQEVVATLGPREALPRISGDRDAYEAQFVLVEALGRLGLLERDLGKVDVARASLERALGISTRLARESPDPRDRVAHARSLSRLARVEAQESPEVALTLLEQAVAQLRPIAGDHLVLPGDPDLLALIYTQLGSVLKAQGRRPEAAGRIREAISAYEVLARGSPENHSFRANLATACFNLANLQLLDAEGASARAGFERARDLWEELVRAFPTATLYRSSLVATHGTLGVIHEHAKRLAEARAALNRSREIGEGLVRDDPTVLKYRSDLGRTYINLGALESEAGRPGEAVMHLEPAREHLREVFRRRPRDRSARDALATACGDLGIGLDAVGRHAEALEAYRECARLELELLRGNDPKPPPSRLLLGTGLLGQARCHRHLGRIAEAARVAEEWRALCDGDPMELCSVAQELMHCSQAAEGTAGSRRYADRAMDLLREAVVAGFRNAEWLRTEPTLDSLRTRADFRDLLADAGFPSHPFAR
jgi:tetratricopeptide (TPR) repeat protein